MKILLVFISAFFLFSCASTKIAPSVCDKSPEDSFLCPAANTAGIRLEDLGNALIIANAIAIGQGLYSREQALEGYKDAKVMISDESLTYSLFAKNLLIIDRQYPGLMDVLWSYFQVFVDQDVVMTSFDRALLVSWIDDRILSLSR